MPQSTTKQKIPKARLAKAKRWEKWLIKWSANQVEHSKLLSTKPGSRSDKKALIARKTAAKNFPLGNHPTKKEVDEMGQALLIAARKSWEVEARKKYQRDKK